jgi:hypothetical protein
MLDLGRALPIMITMSPSDADIRLPAPPGPPAAWGVRAVGRFAVAHVLFLMVCIAIGGLTLTAVGGTGTRTIGPGREFRSLGAAQADIDEDIRLAWGAIALFSGAVSFGAWAWRREYSWVWAALSLIPMVGQLFCVLPATWVLANGTLRAPPVKTPKR